MVKIDKKKDTASQQLNRNNPDLKYNKRKFFSLEDGIRDYIRNHLIADW